MLFLTHFAFWDPGAFAGPVLPCQHQHPQIAIRIRWVPLAASHHHQPECYFIHHPKKPPNYSSEGFCCQSLGGSGAVNGMRQAEGPYPLARRLCQQGQGQKHKGFPSTARGWDPSGCQSLTTLLSLEPICRTALPSWERGGFSQRSEGMLCLISRAQQCQMTPAFLYRLLTTLFITAKWFATRRLPTGLPSLLFDIRFGLH